MRFFYILSILTFSIILTNATKCSNCRAPVVLEDFDIERYLGHWLEYSRYNHPFEEGCDCFNADLFTIDANNIHIKNCCQLTHVSNETQNCAVGVNRVTPLNPYTKDAIFKYTRYGSPFESILWIVDTDYDNYSIVSGCDRVSDNEEREIFWIFSREKELEKCVVKKINDILNVNNFDVNKIFRQRQGRDVCKSERPWNYHDHHHERNLYY